MARIRTLRVLRLQPIRKFSTIPSRRSAAIPFTQSCPSPTCECASVPANLDIDRKAQLLNTMAPYAQQVVVCTGQDDWISNIQQDEGATGEFVRGVKDMIGKGAKAFDPFNNILITASSLPASESKGTTTALLFPSFKRIQNIPRTPESFSDFATAYLKARSLHPMHDGLSTEQKSHLLRDESVADRIPAAEDVTKPTVLICGHGGRDARCGTLGPILETAFREEFPRRGIEGDVAQISHIGGHKFAGNLIMYLPPSMRDNALAGSGIWYGRVGPEHVEGLVEETLSKGRVVVELLRGGVKQGGGDIGRQIEAQLREERGESDGGFRLRPRARA